MKNDYSFWLYVIGKFSLAGAGDYPYAASMKNSVVWSLCAL